MNEKNIHSLLATPIELHILYPFVIRGGTK